MRLRVLGVVMVLTAPATASAETLCVRGPVYIEDGRVTAESDIVQRGLKIECPEDTREITQETESRVLTSTEIRRIRDRNREVAESAEDRK